MGVGQSGEALSGMKMATMLFFVVLLVFSVHVDGARRDGFMPIVMDDERNPPFMEDTVSFHESANVFEDEVPSLDGVPPDFFCNSCRKVSRRAEKILTDPKLFKEVGTLSTEVCRIVPYNLEGKCIEMTEMYIHEAILFLQIVFLEDNLCNSTGFCPGSKGTFSSSTSGENELLSASEPDPVMLSKLIRLLPMGPASSFPSRSDSFAINKVHLKLREYKSCASCRSAVDELRNELLDPDKKIKTIKVLLQACDVVERYADRCKRMVFQYGPLVLAHVQKFLTSNDFCRLVHLCEEAVPTRKETTAQELYQRRGIEKSVPLFRNALAKIFV